MSENFIFGVNLKYSAGRGHNILVDKIGKQTKYVRKISSNFLNFDFFSGQNQSKFMLFVKDFTEFIFTITDWGHIYHNL